MDIPTVVQTAQALDTGVEAYLRDVLPSLGVGGILAGVMFYFYRKDSLVWTKRWEEQSSSWMRVVQDNTSAITKLVDRLDK